LQIFEEIFPLGQDFTYSFLSCRGAIGLVLHVEVRKTRDIKRASDGIPYIRRGAQKLPVSTDQALRRLQLNKGLTSFETETVAASVDSIANSAPIIQFILDIVPIAEPELWLRKQQLVLGDKPTVAGVLLFAEEPQALLPKRCAIKIYRYKTKDRTGSRETLDFDPITVEGHSYVQIDTAVSQTTEIIEDIDVLGEKITYPNVTLHEIITNAVLHRDYSIADDVHVRIFDNRIEVQSPGTLPAHVTVKNILDERYARNGNLVRLINKFPNPPNKDVGEGLNTAFDAMRKLRLKDPQITQGESSVTVFIRHESLSSPEEMVRQYLDTNSSINNSRARELCYINSENRMKRVFERLIQQGLIERIPGRKGRAIAYQKRQSAPSS